MRANRHRRGAALALCIVISTVLTGLVMALAWAASAHAALAGQVPKVDASYYAAEAGLQHAVWKFRHDNQWRATAAAPLTGSITMYDTPWTYQVTCTDSVGDATLAWKFDESGGMSTADSTGRTNTGVFHGGVSWDANGRSGSCIRLDGVNGYVDCGNNASTNLTGDMSFSAWIKMNSGYYDQKIGGNQNGSYGGYKLCIYNSKVEFEVRNASNVYTLNRDVGGGTVLTMGSWYHVVGVYSATNRWIKTYVNGKLDRQLSGIPANALGSTTGSFVMGREPWDSLYYFNGWMDDIRVYARALADADVKALYDTTVDLRVAVSGGGVANAAAASCSIPTPPAPTVPAIASGLAFTIKNLTVNGDLYVDGDVLCTSGSTTVTGNLTYTGAFAADSHLTVQGATTKVTAASVKSPNIDYAALRAQAGMVVAGSSTGQTFSFNSLGGNKVIWIKGDLVDPAVTIGGTFAAGGTFIVDGDVKFTGGTAAIGAAGYPVNIIALGNVTQTGGTVAMVGGLYAEGVFTHKSFDLTGALWIKQGMANNSTGQCTFTSAFIPWFDQRAIGQTSATLPLYLTNHRGIGP
jgi:hypothetical protein